MASREKRSVSSATEMGSRATGQPGILVPSPLFCYPVRCRMTTRGGKRGADELPADWCDGGARIESDGRGSPPAPDRSCQVILRVPLDPLLIPFPSRPPLLLRPSTQMGRSDAFPRVPKSRPAPSFPLSVSPPVFPWLVGVVSFDSGKSFVARCLPCSGKKQRTNERTMGACVFRPEMEMSVLTMSINPPC